MAGVFSNSWVLHAWRLLSVVNYGKLIMRCHWCGMIHHSDHELIYSFLTAVAKITNWLYVPNNGLRLSVMKSNFFACGMVNSGISTCIQIWSKLPDLENLEYWVLNGHVSMWPLYTLYTVEPWFTNLIHSWRLFVTWNVCRPKLFYII
jgi:hypothetical protein